MDNLFDYSRPTFAICDVAGYNLQIEQVDLLISLFINWIKRIEKYS